MHQSVAPIAVLLAGLAAPSLASAEEDLLVHGGYIMTMDPAVGDIADGDVHIRDGRVVAVGRDLQAPTARRLDARGGIVLPGFVDTHSHLYTSLMRGQFRNADGRFFPVSSALAAAMSAEDTGVAMQLGALQLLEGGITTTADFFDNVITPAHAEAGWKGLQASGIGGVVYLGGPDRSTRQPIDLDLLRQMAGAVPAASNLQLGLAWRLPRDRSDAANWGMRDREFRVARGLGLPVQVHVSGEPGPMFDALIQRGYLQSGVTVVHATDATPAQLDALQRAGASLSLTPLSEHRVGYGITRLDHFTAASRQGLGIDGNPLAGTADMYASMRHAALTWSAGTGDEAAPDPRLLLERATRGGALALGLEAERGSLAPGHRADLQIIDTDAINLAGYGGGDPAALVVYDVRPDNVGTVLVGGRVVKHGGRLLHPRQQALQARAQVIAARLRAKAAQHEE
ncbi:MAG: amidohydrolase family protein [Stenotrophomonas sp.]|nr:amidohydrolase family protein [Stenotrophomonas sp.]